MEAQISPLITLEQAKQLVDYLSAGDQASADELIKLIASPLQKELFDEVGRLTRQLHNAIVDFQVDERLIELANTDIPDAKERLNYVIDMTEQAANKTMDAVEGCLPLAATLSRNIASIRPSWDKLMCREIELRDFKTLCHEIQRFIDGSEMDSQQLKSLLNEILLAQDFQDLTGQMIRRVIELVKEVEFNLVSLLTVFCDTPIKNQLDNDKKKMQVEGPIINAQSRQDVVTDQDEVDDLLSSLGF
ncbi:protein phosphatase CheZ [uncultured Shewanella sp.]|uniref:protein phosphatase CheZ n=1 Tax=uncultured Shewanella sp. TaxID=173975 RepID=UPI00262CDD0B|nr:protein phosphatase CheZ [uncultured Shewanella sp.]